MELHAEQDDLQLRADDLFPTITATEVSGPVYLTDPSGNKLTDPSGNYLIAYFNITVGKYVIHATQDDWMLNAE